MDCLIGGENAVAKASYGRRPAGAKVAVAQERSELVALGVCELEPVDRTGAIGVEGPDFETEGIVSQVEETADLILYRERNGVLGRGVARPGCGVAY